MEKGLQQSIMSEPHGHHVYKGIHLKNDLMERHVKLFVIYPSLTSYYYSTTFFLVNYYYSTTTNYALIKLFCYLYISYYVINYR